MRKDRMKIKEYSAGSTVLTVAFVLICLVWIMPIYEVVINSLKSNNAINLDVFALPNSESFVGFANYIKGMTFGNYPFLKSVGYSLFISVVSTALILLCCSMAAWYIARVQSGFAKFFYYLCLFSMIVPDGHVHPDLHRRLPEAEHPLGDSRDLSGLRRGSCHLHVRGLCQGSASGNRGGGLH